MASPTPHGAPQRDRIGFCGAESSTLKLSCKVRLLVYNIRYATGTGPAFHLPIPGAGYLRSNRKVLTSITEFLRAEQPDIVGLIEVDTGSIRTGMLNQAEHIATQLGHYSTFQTQVRRRLDQPVHAHRAQAGQRLPVRAERAR